MKTYNAVETLKGSQKEELSTSPLWQAMEKRMDERIKKVQACQLVASVKEDVGAPVLNRVHQA